MPPELVQLLILQEKDQHLRRLRAEHKKIPSEQEQIRQKLASDTTAVAAAKETTMQNEVAMKNLELQINTRKDTVTKLKVQQFETRKNDEFKALGNEVERYTLDITRLEDEELVLMEKGETLKSNLHAAQAALAATQKMVEAELARLGERETNLKNQFNTLLAERKTKTEGVDPDLLERYQRIFQNKGDSAIAELNGQVCSGCHMKVTAACAATAKADRILGTCSNCGRFLYIAHFD